MTPTTGQHKVENCSSIGPRSFRTSAQYLARTHRSAWKENSAKFAGVLRGIAGDYLCPIAATNGQAGGFLHTEVAPLIAGTESRRVLYLGDLDLSGGHIEANTRNVLAAYAPLHWARVAITRAQVEEHGFEVKTKRDHRYKDGRDHAAVETEALEQTEIVRLLTEALEERVSEPLVEVLEREERQRVQVRERLSADE